jgi:translation elongation factor EF-Tu-like GTPase
VREDLWVTNVPEETFRLRVEQAFNVSGRGTAVFGVIEQGVLHVGDEVRLMRGDNGPVAVCVGIDAAPRYSREQDQPFKVGLILPALDAADVHVGDLIVQA